MTLISLKARGSYYGNIDPSLDVIKQKMSMRNNLTGIGEALPGGRGGGPRSLVGILKCLVSAFFVKGSRRCRNCALVACIAAVPDCGNALVTFLTAIRARLHTTPIWFVAYLSIADLLVGFVVAPTYIYTFWSQCAR